MPVLLAEDGYVFRFFSSDGSEPPHVHVRGNGGIAKVWLVLIPGSTWPPPLALVVVLALVGRATRRPAALREEAGAYEG